VTIPDKALKIDLKKTGGELTLDEMCLFQPGGFNLVEFRALLRTRSNWTHEEIGGLIGSELEEVAKQLGEALKRSAVPLGKRPRSKTGRG